MARLVSRLPFDIAPKARLLTLRRDSPLKESIQSRAKILSRNGNVTSSPAPIHLPPVRELSLLVEEKEIRRAGSPVLFGRFSATEIPVQGDRMSLFFFLGKTDSKNSVRPQLSLSIDIIYTLPYVLFLQEGIKIQGRDSTGYAF